MVRSRSARHGLALLAIAFQAIALLLAQAGPLASAADRALDLPRYRLDVGQELKYKGETDFRYQWRSKSHSFGNRNEWSVWVVGKNGDGSSRVVIRYTETRQREGKTVGSPQSTLAYCDVFADGQIAWNPSLGLSFDPSLVFPRLPTSRQELAGGWESLRDHERGRSLFTVLSHPASASARTIAAGPDAGVWTIREVDKTPFDEITLATHASTVTFDPRQGLVTKNHGEKTDAYAYTSTGKGTDSRDLVSVERHDAAATKQLWDEAERYFQARLAYDKKTEQAVNDAKTCQKLLDEAKALLTTARKGVRLPIVQEQLDKDLKEHAQMAGFTLADANRRANVLGQAAADWELPDLSGQRHTLKDYRGKVVILDFWYRDCPWCLRAMPQVKQLAHEFRDQPVVVLGMNTDPDAADARFAAEKLKLDYTVLKTDWQLPKKYGVFYYPTLVIIDRQGRVHALHSNYSPTLQQDVAERVRELLAKK